MSTSGHWDKCEKNGKQYFCLVSGGYVLVGARFMSLKEGFQVTDNENCQLEQFSATNSVRGFIKQNLGDKTLEEIEKKVTQLIALRNKKTSGPAKES